MKDIVSIMIKLADREFGSTDGSRIDKPMTSNLYVADATILPHAMGFSPILTIMALAKRIASLL